MSAAIRYTTGYNPSYYTDENGDAYCIEDGHDTEPLDSRYGCRHCPKEEA
jgi:hypothetical protein